MKTQNNKVSLIGHIGSTPTIKLTKKEKKIAFLTLGTHEYRKTEDGKTMRITTWHKVVVLGKGAEITETFLHKGSTVNVEGKLRNKTYKHTDGTCHSKTEIIANNIVIMGVA